MCYGAPVVAAQDVQRHCLARELGPLVFDRPGSLAVVSRVLDGVAAHTSLNTAVKAIGPAGPLSRGVEPLVAPDHGRGLEGGQRGRAHLSLPRRGRELQGAPADATLVRAALSRDAPRTAPRCRPEGDPEGPRSPQPGADAKAVWPYPARTRSF
jgi:hypothetical protein